MKYFEEPTLELLRLLSYDVLTFSGDEGETEEEGINNEIEEEKGGKNP